VSSLLGALALVHKWKHMLPVRLRGGEVVFAGYMSSSATHPSFALRWCWSRFRAAL
jgi:hypothetical protein